MAVAETARLSGGSLSSADLRQLWEAGRRGPAIHGALDQWEQLLARGDDLAWLQDALRSCGLEAEAFAVQAQTTRRLASTRDWEALIRSVLQSGDPWWARELIEAARSSSAELEALRIEIELALGDAAALLSAWQRDHRDPAGLEAAVRWWVRAGRIDAAERLLDEAVDLPLWRARFALWRKQPAVARAQLARVPPSAEWRCLEAVAAIQEGRLEEAESLLRALQDSDARAEASSWLATVLRKQNRHAEALQAAQDASIASPTFSLVARLERELAAFYDAHERINASPLARLLRSIGLSRAALRTVGEATRQTIGELEHAEGLYALGLRPRDPIERLEAALERFGGNHTPHLTTTDRGRLIPYRPPPNPRELGAGIQLVVWTRGVQAARDLYRELAPRVDHPLFRIYQGELELWMGAYEEAARIFRDIIGRDRGVKWSWIGLGATAMLQGELRQAQKIWRKGVSLSGGGPTLYAYRGECYRRQGKRDRARRDLEVAVRAKPQRLSAWINLALLDGHSEALEQAERRCAEIAPVLMEEIEGNPAERLEQVLEAMRGNRSSSIISYHLWGRVWRSVAAP